MLIGHFEAVLAVVVAHQGIRFESMTLNKTTVKGSSYQTDWIDCKLKPVDVGV